MEDGRLLSKEDLRAKLASRKCFNLSWQVEYVLEHAECLTEGTIRDESVFHNMLPLTFIISDRALPRTLKALCETIRADYPSLDDLVRLAPCPGATWWERFRAICCDFDWCKVGPLFITRVTKHERAGTPAASYAILDGIHCSLAGMYLMECGRTAFQPVNVVYLLPRLNFPPRPERSH